LRRNGLTIETDVYKYVHIYKLYLVAHVSLTALQTSDWYQRYKPLQGQN